MNEKTLNIKYYSQHGGVKEEFWRTRSCGIVSLYTCLSYFNRLKGKSLDDLIKEGEAIGGYSKDGWLHDALVRLSRNHGVLAYSQEFKSIDVDWENKKFGEGKNQEALFLKGLEKIRKEILEGRPVIMSMNAGFGANNGPHLTVVVGINDSGFYFNDPDDRGGENREKVFVSKEEVLKYWRGFCVFFED